MESHQLVERRVRPAYWDQDWNCAVTTLHILAEVFDIVLDQQVLDAAIGMHGAGGYRAQCGLVEGALMFIGILGQARGLSDDEVVKMCYNLAQAFNVPSFPDHHHSDTGVHPSPPMTIPEVLNRL